MQPPDEKIALASIGVPLFNEERFLRKSLDSLINQDYKNLEIIICDNGSTDDTSKICKEYCKQHNHIQYHRFKQNIGATANFKAVLERAEGDYFMWAAGHDLWATDYVSNCIQTLQQNPDAIIAFGSSRWIGEDDAPYPRKYGWYDTRGMGDIERFITVLWGNMHPILGVIKTGSLKSAPLINTVGADLIMLCHLALIGDFVHATNTHWSRREFRQESSHSEKLNRYQQSHQGFTRSVLAKLFPLLKLPGELIKVVVNSRQPLLNKLLILTLLLPSLPVRYYAGKVKKL